MVKNDYYNLHLDKKSKISPSQSFYVLETLIKLKYYNSRPPSSTYPPFPPAVLQGGGTGDYEEWMRGSLRLRI
jgi:hypothetical protein